MREVTECLDHNRIDLDCVTYLKRGWPVGSGVIEHVSWHLVKDGMAFSGMRWAVVGTERGGPVPRD